MLKICLKYHIQHWAESAIAFLVLAGDFHFYNARGPMVIHEAIQD